MIKRLAVVQARDGMNRNDALTYWRESHAPLVVKVPGITKYVQNHCTDGAAFGSEPPFLGIGEVWFGTRDDAERALASPEWQAVLDDARTFMELSRVVAGWVEVVEFSQ